jgi:hypothetical protein
MTKATESKKIIENRAIDPTFSVGTGLASAPP